MKKLVFVFLLAGLFCGGQTLGNVSRPNFLIFLTDDQGWGDLGCYGHPRILSPNLDRFAEEGIKLTQCYAASAVCSPSRSAILTGRTPYRNGVYTWLRARSPVHLRSSEITIAKLLQQNGYATCHSGKWHLGKLKSDEQPTPSDHGYDWWMATDNNASPNHMNPKNFVRNGKEVGRLEGPSAVIAANEAIHWLENEKPADKPFFICVWTHEPHKPIESAPKFMEAYSDLDEDFRQHHGNITQLDHAFGLMMDTLDKKGLRDNTFVFFTSDNGPEGAGDSGRTRGSTGGLNGRKRSMYEGGIRVPGLFQWPAYFKKAGLKPGTTIDTPVIGSDILPTILAITGIQMPDDRILDGVNMLPILHGKEVPREQPLFWRYSAAALREGDWKIIASKNFSEFELYNLKDDWQEQNDLSNANPEKLQAMKKRIIEHNKAVVADGPVWPKKKSKKSRD
jgi:arylsulfatase A